MRDVRVGAEGLRDGEALQVALQQSSDLRDIRSDHLAEARRLDGVSCRILSHEAGNGRASWEGRETNVDKLWRVEVAVVVPACAEGSRNNNTRSVDCLPNILQVHTPRDLLDEHRRQALGTQLLVHTQEVDLSRVEQLRAASQLHGDTRDERDKLASLLHSDANVPVSRVPRGSKSPGQELLRVPEAEHGIVVLDVVFCQKDVHLVHLEVRQPLEPNPPASRP